jgi:hypothetical protein
MGVAILVAYQPPFTRTRGPPKSICDEVLELRANPLQEEDENKHGLLLHHTAEAELVSGAHRLIALEINLHHLLALHSNAVFIR